MLIPRKVVPSLQLDTLADGFFDLSVETPANFTLLVFYRGLHCPICAKYLLELSRLLPDYEQRGVGVLVVSSDTRERALDMQGKIGSAERKPLRFGYGLTMEKAREWGLYLSTSRGKTSIGIEEPGVFAEPGVFLVRPDRTLYYTSVQNMPFARPHFDELLQAIDFAVEKNYPARGEYVEPGKPS